MMGDVILRTWDLVKKYQDKTVVNSINIQINRGKIYGFIGENGAGKTTTIRMLTGLSDPSAGKVEIFGATSVKSLKTARKKIGSIVESPILFLNQTAEQNLKMQCILYNKKNYDNIPSLLEKVGLLNVSKKKAGDFSLGMKQRLGIAMTLIQEPELLILDEPVNGLDPMGMIEIRKLLIRLNQEEGITILISSHILAELHMLATDFIIISHGTVLAQLTLEEMNERCRKKLVIKTDQDNKNEIINLLKQHYRINSYEVRENQILIYDNNDELINANRTLGEAGIYATEIKFLEKTLEEYYIEVIGGAQVETIS